MSNHGRFAEDGNPGAGAEVRKEKSPSESPLTRSPESQAKKDDKKKAASARYPDMQSANTAETQNISANGVLFQVDSEMPIGSLVDFTISLPADVVGAEADVQLDCRGRVVRNFEEDGRRGVGVVIDEYRFERR